VKKLVASLVVAGAIVAGFLIWRGATTYNDAQLIQCLPQARATHVFLDVEKLRRGGVLDLIAGSKSAEDADYKAFLEHTGLNYRTDIDAIAAAFSEGNTYLAMRGRFDWKKLSAYVASQGGRCSEAACSMAATRAGYFVSLTPLRRAVLAIAVSTDEHGVRMIGLQDWRKPPRLPQEPVWLSVPSYALSEASLGAGTHAFLEPLSQAQDVIFAAGAAGGGFQLRVEATCATPEIAELMTRRLASSTDMLKKMLEREHLTASPNDLSGVLVAGTFTQQKERVNGSWPISRGFLESLAGGELK
jgi:hypothetical protein